VNYKKTFNKAVAFRQIMPPFFASSWAGGPSWAL